MNSKKHIKLLDINHQIASSLSSDQHYLLLYSHSKEPNKEENQKIQKGYYPELIPIVFRNDQTITIAELVEKYIQEAKHSPFITSLKPENLKKICLQMEKGSVLDNDKSISSLKKYLRTDNIDGLKLYPKVIHPFDSCQCGVLEYIYSQASFFKGTIEVPFTLVPNHYIVYIHVALEDNLQKITQKLSHQIQLIFGQQVNPQFIEIKIHSDNKWTDLKNLHIPTLNQSDNIQFWVKKMFLTPPKNYNNNYLVVKGAEITTTPFQYDSIKSKKVIDLLKTIQPLQDWRDFGLLISEFPLKSNDKIEKASALFPQSSPHPKHIIGLVIKQMHLFELELPKIQSQGKTNIEGILFNDKSNREHEKTCEQEIVKRANETTIASFKNDLDSIKPILLYTSELRVCGSNQQTPAPIYYTLNEFLRTQHFCQTSENDYNKWEYRFECEILHQLRKIPIITDKTLWRGVSYVPSYKTGEVFMFKQFLSSSILESAAKEFAYKAIFKIVKSHSGHCIKQFSFYKQENEILFEPYVYFKVLSITHIENELHKTIIPCYEIEQLPRQQLPTNIVRFVLWVDDKTEEGKRIWHQFKHISTTTLMLQLLSTAELKQWLENNQKILTDPEIEVIMISNMTRNQKGIINKEAGVDAVRIFKQFLPKSFIFIFIGWRQGAIDKLSQHGLYPDHFVTVSEYTEDLMDFLKERWTGKQIK